MTLLVAVVTIVIFILARLLAMAITASAIAVAVAGARRVSYAATLLTAIAVAAIALVVATTAYGPYTLIMETMGLAIRAWRRKGIEVTDFVSETVSTAYLAGLFAGDIATLAAAAVADVAAAVLTGLKYVQWFRESLINIRMSVADLLLAVPVADKITIMPLGVNTASLLSP